MRRLKANPAPQTALRGAGRNPRRSGWRPDRRLLLRSGLTLGVLLVAGGLGWLWHSGWVAGQLERGTTAAYRLSVEAGLAVDDVLVEGRRRTERSAILEALDVARGTPILAFDPHRAKDRLQALPWVRHAEVERRLPGLVYVRLTERLPLALWQLDGHLSVIDDGGAVVPRADAAGFSDLPLVVGSDAPEHAAVLLRMLASEPDLQRLVAAAVRVGGRRWNLQLTSGIDVQLPETEPERAWAQLARFQREHSLLERDVLTIDLRLPDRLVVRTAPGARQQLPLAPRGENT